MLEAQEGTFEFDDLSYLMICEGNQRLLVLESM